MDTWDVIVAGGGASGLCAAISAAREGAKVLVIERNAQPGQKILATGNGRCNFTNTKMDSAFFRGEDPSFVLGALNAFSEDDAIEFFRSIGIEPREKNGYVYPRSLQASGVRAALVNEAKRLGVRMVCLCRVISVTPGRDGIFAVKSDVDTYFGRRCIIASGGMASPASGSDGSMFPVLKRLGIPIVEPLPALVPLISKDGFLRGLSGVRSECRVSFFAGGKLMSVSEGEIQFTDYGISGIVVFDGSRHMARGLHNNKKCHVTIDFYPELTREAVKALIEGRLDAFGAEGTLNGLFNSKLARAILAASDGSPESMADIIKECRLDITGTKDFDRAQVTSGGVDTSCVDGLTMEHKDIPGLYFAGEILDVDGICGGYNLQWAWSSGFLAGRSAAL